MSTHNDNETTSSYSGRSHRRHRSTSNKRGGSRIVVAVAIIEGLVILAMLVRLYMIDTYRTELAVSLEKKDAELNTVIPEINRLKKDIDALVINRLPHVTLFEFDKIIPIEKHIVRNISFTQIGTAKEKHFEYKIVLLNQELTAVVPDIDILFFNDIGLQIGTVRIGGLHGIHVENLERGETRTSSAPVTLDADGEPKYFLVQSRSAR